MRLVSILTRPLSPGIYATRYLLSLTIPAHPFITKLQATIYYTRQPHRVRCERVRRALNPLVFPMVVVPLLDHPLLPHSPHCILCITS